MKIENIMSWLLLMLIVIGMTSGFNIWLKWAVIGLSAVIIGLIVKEYLKRR